MYNLDVVITTCSNLAFALFLPLVEAQQHQGRLDVKSMVLDGKLMVATTTYAWPSRPPTQTACGQP